ncbi:hypothetical protein JW766_04230 [Candidatus Dojkabacteria bacterium]|nr:hypothetical protein [Candidatus Dojkabacteria bacterium]
MQNQARAEICKKCGGQGFTPGTNNVCENCRGIGAIGTDGVNEYYLALDEKGNPQIAGIKSSIQPTSQEAHETKLAPQRKLVLRGLIFVIMIICYAAFLGIYFSWINEKKVFWAATIIFLGFIALYALYDVKLVNKTVDLFINLIIKKPNDFATFVERKSNESKVS